MYCITGAIENKFGIWNLDFNEIWASKSIYYQIVYLSIKSDWNPSQATSNMTIFDMHVMA